jgi:hypothetical protein
MSSPLILRDFQITRDFRQIKWGATLWYNLLRSVSAGIIIGVFLAYSEKDPMTGLTAPLIWPLLYLTVFLPLGIVLSFLGRIPFVGLFAAFIALIAVSIGDPVVCILHKFFPKIVPVAAPPVFSFFIIFWVLDAPELSIAD